VGTFDVQATFGSAVPAWMHVISLYDVDQGTPTDTPQSVNLTAGSAIALTMNTAAGDLPVVGLMINGASSGVATSNDQFISGVATFDSDVNLGTAGSKVATGATQAFNWTAIPDGAYRMVGVNVNITAAVDLSVSTIGEPRVRRGTF